MKPVAGKGAHHGPDGVADCLSDGTADEDDVRDAEDRPAAEVVAQHACDEAAEEGTDGC